MAPNLTSLPPLPDQIFDPAWSPDGTVIRFRVGGLVVTLGSLWQVAVDGTNLHPLLPGWHNPPSECCGKWTADGKYFVFQSQPGIWALAEKGNWFGKAGGQPFQVTSGPMTFFSPVPARMAKSCSWWARWRAGSWLATIRSPQSSFHFFPEFPRIASASLKMGSGSPIPAIRRRHCGKANWTAASGFSLATRRPLLSCLAGHPMAPRSLSMLFCRTTK